MPHNNIAEKILPITLLLIMSITGCHNQKTHGIIDRSPSETIHTPTLRKKSSSNIRSAKYYFQLGKQKMENKQYETSNFYLKKLIFFSARGMVIRADPNCQPNQYTGDF